MSPNPAILTWPYVAPAGGGGLSLSFIGTTAGTGGTAGPASVTFSAVSLGAADATRTIIVAVAIRCLTSHDQTAVTVAGVSATKDAFALDGLHSVGIWRAEVPTGTTGNIVVTQDASFDYWTGLAVWSITGAAVTAVDFATSDVDPAPLSVTVSAGDLVVAGASVDANNGIAWTNATERYETAISSASSSRIMGGADATAATSGTLAVSADYGTHSYAAGASVAYSPS